MFLIPDFADMSSSFVSTDTPLSIVRLALIVGTTLFGGIAWFLANSIADGSGIAPELLNEFPLVPVVITALFVVLVIGIAVVRVQQRAWGMSPLAGWALAEVMAMLGAAYLLMVGDPVFFVAGLVAQLIVSFVVLPLK